VFGVNAHAALRLAADEINRGDGVALPGGARGRIQVTYFNQLETEHEVLEVARTLAGEDWLAAIGPTCAKVAAPVFGALQRRVGDSADAGLQFPIFNDAAGLRPGLAKVSEWAFRNTPDEPAMYERLLGWIKERHPGLTTVAGGMESDFFHSRLVWQLVKSASQKLGWGVVGEEKWLVRDTELVKQVERWKQAAPDVVVIAARPASACRALREMRRQEVKPKVVVGLSSAATLEMLRDCGPEAEGMLVPTTFAPVTPDARRLAETLARRYRVSFDLYSAAAWENLQVLKQVIEASGVEARPTTVQADRRRIRDGLAKLREFPGLLGTVRRTDDRESVKPYLFVQAKGRDWVVVHDQR
jgi:branched-chain amino acid transport system substrate-binding protein